MIRAAPAPHSVIGASRGRREDFADLLDDRAQRLELLDRGGDRRGDVGVDAGIAEIGAVGDAPALDPVLDAIAKIAVMRRQSVGVAGVETA